MIAGPEEPVTDLPEIVHDAKLRRCLRCRRNFPSAWVGERICPRCKASSSWKSGVPIAGSPTVPSRR